MEHKTQPAVPRHLSHKGDPCIYCGKAADKVEAGPCSGLLVLHPEELRLLMAVPTTAGEARQLICRNEAGLDKLDNWGNSDNSEAVPCGLTVSIGCPHCVTVGGLFDCESCAYPEVDKRSRKVRGGCQCCAYTFGGVWAEASGESSPTTDTDRVKSIGHMIILTAGYLTILRNPLRHAEDVDDLRTWFLGHIQWGWEVLKRYRAAEQ